MYHAAFQKSNKALKNKTMQGDYLSSCVIIVTGLVPANTTWGVV